MVHLGARSVDNICVFGRLQALGSFCMCVAGGTVCRGMSVAPAKVD